MRAADGEIISYVTGSLCAEQRRGFTTSNVLGAFFVVVDETTATWNKALNSLQCQPGRDWWRVTFTNPVRIVLVPFGHLFPWMVRVIAFGSARRKANDARIMN